MGNLRSSFVSAERKSESDAPDMIGHEPVVVTYYS